MEKVQTFEHYQEVENAMNVLLGHTVSPDTIPEIAPHLNMAYKHFSRYVAEDENANIIGMDAALYYFGEICHTLNNAMAEQLEGFFYPHLKQKEEE